MMAKLLNWGVGVMHCQNVDNIDLLSVEIYGARNAKCSLPQNVSNVFMRKLEN